MGKLKYHLVVTYRQTYRRWSVKIVDPDLGDDYDFTMSISFGDNLLPLITEMRDWCRTEGVGKRTAYDEFMFKTEAEATMFVLRFS